MVYNVLLSAEDISAEKPGPNKETTETEDVISLISFFFVFYLCKIMLFFLRGTRTNSIVSKNRNCLTLQRRHLKFPFYCLRLETCLVL